MINLTPIAANKVKEIMNMQNPVPAALRVAVVGGGGETNLSNDTATDPTSTVPLPDMTITKSHNGSFTAATVPARSVDLTTIVFVPVTSAIDAVQFGAVKVAAVHGPLL